MVKQAKQAWNQQTRQRPTKQQVRGLERLLKRDSLPPEVRAAKESELAKLTGDVQKQNRVSREKHFSKKYHGVKFVERRKVERRIEQLQRKIAQPPSEGANDVASLQDELREAQHDLLYIQHFPRSKKYLSLFPTEGGDDPYVSKRRRRIRALIVRRIEAGLPVGQLDEAEDEPAAATTAKRGSTSNAVAADDFFADAPAEAEEPAARPEGKPKRERRDRGGERKRSKEKW